MCFRVGEMARSLAMRRVAVPPQHTEHASLAAAKPHRSFEFEWHAQLASLFRWPDGGATAAGATRWRRSTGPWRSCEAQASPKTFSSFHERRRTLQNVSPRRVVRPRTTTQKQPYLARCQALRVQSFHPHVPQTLDGTPLWLLPPCSLMIPTPPR